jgi:CO dehydrogenase maturation factor
VGLKALRGIMRIVIVGKAGSGKTTPAAILVRALSEKGKTVLAIDADINQHLATTLGYSAELIGAD